MSATNAEFVGFHEGDSSDGTPIVGVLVDGERIDLALSQADADELSNALAMSGGESR